MKNEMKKEMGNATNKVKQNKCQDGMGLDRLLRKITGT